MLLLMHCHSCLCQAQDITSEGLTLSKLQTTTAEDDTLKAVLGYVRTQWPLKEQIPADFLAYYYTWNELHVEQDCLMRD